MAKNADRRGTWVSETVSPTNRGTLPDRSPLQPVASLATAVWSGEVIVAVLVASRRFAGAFVPPASPWLGLLAACGCAVISLICCALHATTSVPAKHVVGRVSVLLLTAVPPVVVGMSLLPNSSAAGFAFLLVLCTLVGFGATLLVGGLAGGEVWNRFRSPDVPSPVAPAEQPSEVADAIADVPEPLPFHRVPAGETAESAEGPGANVSQWMSRTMADDGTSETIEGVVAVSFEKGQKTAVVHLSFLPPLGAVPELECEPQEGPDVRLRTAAVHNYGARVEVRRVGATDDDARVEIAYAAFSAVPQDRAA